MSACHPSQLYEEILQRYVSCTLCPRHCRVNRLAGETGFCGQTMQLRAARAALHMWEEPCISGAAGSGTVFFSGCNLRCIYCQNHDIALGQTGKEISASRLTEIFLELQQKGAANINLVTPTHYLPTIVCALQRARFEGLSLPVVYNCGGYEDANALKLLEGLVDIYLPDFKYMSAELSARYSHAPDYSEKTKSALAEMFRQVGQPVFYHPDSSLMSTAFSDPPQTSGAVYPAGTPLLRRGMLVRHLVLPGQVKDTKKILHYLHDTYGNDIHVSVMCQYTPLSHVADCPDLNRPVTPEEYGRVVDYCMRLGMENVYIQEGNVAVESFIPPFDLSGLSLSGYSSTRII
ncbi:MAG: radical SAM protein, partial [Acetatifactor sp.]|nr:radical SAM protein [Acetatifactor sp.]